VCVCVCVSVCVLYKMSWEQEEMKVMVHGPNEQILDSSSVKSNIIRAGDVALAVGRLLCKCESLSSNPSPTPQKK
jgi:hypothetical protein